ncbi:MAG: DNA-3-methyladenine glycosylase 2 family protein [Syntrophobacter sp.]
MDLIAFSLEPVAPFRLDLTVWALRRRPENTIDRWDGSTYRRILIAQEHPVEVEIIQTGPSDKPLLRIATTGARLSPDTKTLVISALTRMLGINADLTGFYRFAEHQPKLDAIARQFKGVKPPRFPTVFEALVNAIACQQVSQTVGILFINRLAQRYARSIEKQGEVFHGFPDPEDLAPLAPEALRTLGFSYQKARAIIELASAIAEKRLNLDELNNLDNQTAVDRLIKLRGVGRWTAEYVLLRGVGRRQVFPGDDVGARNNLQRWLGLSETLDYQGVRESIAPWSTYGGLIYFHLLLKRLADAGFLDSGKETGRRDD